MEQDREGLQSVSRGIRVVEYLCMANEECGVMEISKALGVNKTTIFRILSTLVIMGFAEQNLKTEKYRVTMKILLLANKVLDQLEIRKVSIPFLTELVQETGLSSHLAVLDNHEIVIVEKATAETGLVFHVGRRGPLYCTGIGKVFLAHMSENDFNNYLEQDFIAHTPSTIVEAAALKEEISRIAVNGYAVDWQEHNLGVACVAAPVRDFTGKVVAAVSVTGANVKVENNVEGLAKVILDITKKLSERLGYLS